MVAVSGWGVSKGPDQEIPNKTRITIRLMRSGVDGSCVYLVLIAQQTRRRDLKLKCRTYRRNCSCYPRGIFPAVKSQITL
jgi:hypothetical protein